MADSFDIGNVIRLKVAFTDSNGVPVDPTTVQLDVRLFGGAVQTYTYGGGQVLRLGTGIYYYDYTPASPGLYYYRYSATGDAVAANDAQFSITKSPAIGTWPSPPAC